MNPITWILSPLAKLGEVVTWYKLAALALANFYAVFALVALVALIVVAWKSPKMPWFTGKLALGCFAGLLLAAGVGFLAVVYNQEIEPRIDHARPAEQQKARPHPHVPAAGGGGQLDRGGPEQEPPAG